MRSLWYPESGPDHALSLLADQTVLWSLSDTEELYSQNRQDPEKSRLLDKFGWTADNITYRYNHQGFRCEQFDDRPAGLAIGCSITQGVGLREEQIWPSLLSNLLNIHIWNLAVVGMGITSNFRILNHYLPILKPRFVVHCVPCKYRFEYRNELGHKTNISPLVIKRSGDSEFFFKLWFSDDENSDLQTLAYSLAIKSICQEHGIPYYDLPSEGFKYNGLARDLKHPGVVDQEEFAHRMHALILQSQGESNGDPRICSKSTT